MSLRISAIVPSVKTRIIRAGITCHWGRVIAKKTVHHLCAFSPMLHFFQKLLMSLGRERVRLRAPVVLGLPPLDGDKFPSHELG